MQYYHKADEAMRSGDEYPLQLAKNAGMAYLGGGIASAGSKAIGKLIPAIGSLINPYVPDKLSMAGLKKVDPRFGKFINDALDQGYNYDDLRTFLGGKVEQAHQQIKPPEPPKQNRNPIEQHSPDLHRFITEEIQNGRSPLQAGALASLKFKKEISKITKEYKSPWSAILESVYGSEQSAQKSPNQQQMDQQQQDQSGPGEEALKSILEKINQRLGK